MSMPFVDHDPTPRPELIVFDLDFTLWDAGGTWCDCLSPPFSLQTLDAGEERVVDRSGRHVRLYDGVLSALDWCHEHAIPMALASRTDQPTWARELVELLGITDRFAHAEIYPSSKLAHFDALHEASGVPYERMLFFDDEMRNIRDVGTLGVTCVAVKNGLTDALFEHGLSVFADLRASVCGS